MVEAALAATEAERTVAQAEKEAVGSKSVAAITASTAPASGNRIRNFVLETADDIATGSRTALAATSAATLRAVYATGAAASKVSRRDQGRTCDKAQFKNRGAVRKL